MVPVRYHLDSEPAFGLQLQQVAAVAVASYPNAIVDKFNYNPKSEDLLKWNTIILGPLLHDAVDHVLNLRIIGASQEINHLLQLFM